MAIPLTRFLTAGSYEGFDILPELIEWCQSTISPRFPTFQFQLANVRHDLYNKDANLSVTDFCFPFEDDSFDFTFLTSVFTHLVPEDLECYTAEIARTLRPGGTVVITYFILNEESETLMKTADSKMNIEHEFGRAGAKVMDVLRPEAVIAFPETYVRSVLSQSGLTVQEPIHYGFWCGRPSGVTFQDLVVCRK